MPSTRLSSRFKYRAADAIIHPVSAIGSARGGDTYPLRLSDSGRYTHHPDHLREVAAKSGLILARLEEGFLRMEGGVEVIGLLALLRKPALSASHIAEG